MEIRDRRQPLQPDELASGETNKVTFPIGIGANRTLYLGKLPTRVGGEVDYTIAAPDVGPRSTWTFKLTFTAVIPHGQLLDAIRKAGLK